MKAFITGVTGFFRNNLVKEGRARGMEVTALVRRQDAWRLVGTGMERLEGVKP